MLKMYCLCALVIGCCLISMTEGKKPLELQSLIIENKEGNWTWQRVEMTLKRLVPEFVVPNLKVLRHISSQLDITSDCRETLFEAAMALRRAEAWVIKMIDATAKVPSGVLDGTFIDFGSYDECLSIWSHSTTSDRSDFQGKYCLVGFRHPLLSTRERLSDRKSYDIMYGKPPQWVGDKIKRGGGFMKNVAIWLGACIPSSCTRQDLLNIVQLVSRPMGFNVSIENCHIDEPHIWKSSEIAAVCVLGMLLLLVIIGTTADTLSRLSVRSDKIWTDMKATLHVEEHWLLRILKSFSLTGNTERLLHASGSGNSMLGFLHGIRFLSATWIILGHTYFFVDRWMYLKYRHLMGLAEEFDRKFPAAVIENFTIPVGSFFFISGFLMTYTNWTKIEEKGGTLNLPIFFFHKYWRMTPALGLTMTLFIAIPLIGSGPLWDSTFDPEVQRCLNNWWKNLLYINNWWKVDEFCLIHTWYLAALMQFHVIGILLLLLFYRWPIFTATTSALIILTCSIWTALEVVWKDFPMPAPGMIKDLDKIADYNSDIYIKLYAHIASYLIGMASGFIIIKYRYFKLSTVQKSCGWTTAVGLALASVYGIYGPSEEVALRAVYISLHRIAWALAITWVTFSCAAKSAGIVNNILSWGAFQPLGQLSYLAYLLHPLVILYRNGSLRERVYYSHSELVLTFLSNCVVSFFLAFICFVAVELPFSALEAMALSSSKVNHRKQTNTVFSNGIPQVILSNQK